MICGVLILHCLEAFLRSVISFRTLLSLSHCHRVLFVLHLFYVFSHALNMSSPNATLTPGPSSSDAEDGSNIARERILKQDDSEEKSEKSEKPHTFNSQNRNEYTFDNLKGWRKYRVLRPCRGMYHEIRRRLPYYWSDITDAWIYRTFASTVRMYSVKSSSLPHLFNKILIPIQSPPSASLYPRHGPPNKRLLRHQRVTLLLRPSSPGLRSHKRTTTHNYRNHRIDISIQLYHLWYYQGLWCDVVCKVHGLYGDLALASCGVEFVWLYAVCDGFFEWDFRDVCWDYLYEWGFSLPLFWRPSTYLSNLQPRE